MRDVLEDGSVQLAAGGCTFRYERLRPGVLRITIHGSDRGQFGFAPLDELAAEHARLSRPLAVFIDATEAAGPSTSVMEAWSAWLSANAEKLELLTVLIPDESKLLHLTVSIARHLSNTGDLLRICSSPEAFEAAIARRLGRS